VFGGGLGENSHSFFSSGLMLNRVSGSPNRLANSGMWIGSVTITMKWILPTVFLGLFASSWARAGELSKIGLQFIEAAAAGNSDALAKTYIDAPSKEAAVAAFKEASQLIAGGKIKVSKVERELVIGDLGVTLFSFEMDGNKDLKPIICVRDQGEWKVYPWATESDMNGLLKTRTPDEQIHLQLFDEWARLVEKQMEEQAKGAAKPTPSKASPKR
jgi:hypothetical protein